MADYPRDDTSDSISLCFDFRNEAFHGSGFFRIRATYIVRFDLRMAELQQTMDTLDYKCWFYETAAARGSTEGISDLPDEALPEALRPVRERLRAAAEAETEEV